MWGAMLGHLPVMPWTSGRSRPLAICRRIASDGQVLLAAFRSTAQVVSSTPGLAGWPIIPEMLEAGQAQGVEGCRLPRCSHGSRNSWAEPRRMRSRVANLLEYELIPARRCPFGCQYHCCSMGHRCSCSSLPGFCVNRLSLLTSLPIRGRGIYGNRGAAGMPRPHRTLVTTSSARTLAIRVVRKLQEGSTSWRLIVNTNVASLAAQRNLASTRLNWAVPVEQFCHLVCGSPVRPMTRPVWSVS